MILFINNKPNSSLKFTILYDSIPLNELKTLFTNHINNANLSEILQENFCKLLNLCLSQNYCQVNKNFYTQKTAYLCEKVHISTFIIDLYVTPRKKTDPFNQHVHFWIRYVDKIFSTSIIYQKHFNFLWSEIRICNQKPVKFPISAYH